MRSNPGVTTVRIYHYPTCSTCKRARKWLDARGIEHEAIHIVEAAPSKAVLKRAMRASGLELKRLFNTSGNAYRDGDYSQKLKTMSEDEALTALANNGMLIKRPLLIRGDTVLVGFKEDAYTAAL